MIGSDLLNPLPDQGFADKQAKVALLLTVAVHIGTFLVGILSPYLLYSNKPLPEIYTVNLVAVTDPASQPAPKPRAVKQIAPATPKKVAKPAAKPVAKVAPPPTAAPPPKPAITTRPIREKTAQDLKAVESLRKQFQARQEAEKADEQAKKAITDALAAIKQTLQSSPRPTIDVGAKTSETAISSATSGPSGGQIIAEAKRQYFAAVYEKIKAHFILPDLKNWQPNLQAILVMEVRRDGIVTRSDFEQKSENIFFNQAVERAVSEAAPMPPFPKQLKESRLEFGLRFRPGDLL